jgi:hypothetical protein
LAIDGAAGGDEMMAKIYQCLSFSLPCFAQNAYMEWMGSEWEYAISISK